MRKFLLILALAFSAPVVSAGTMWTGDDAAPPPGDDNSPPPPPPPPPPGDDDCECWNVTL